jgi:hypothetical protein
VKLMSIVLIILVFIGVILWLLSKRGPDLAVEYKQQLDFETRSDKSRPQPVITEESIAGLPPPVQRYLRMNGSIGKPRVASIHLSFDAEMFQKPGQSGMTGPAEQYDRFDPPKRLFFMKTRMYGLHVNVLHDYHNSGVSMRVRIASLFNAVNIRGKELAKTETVTLLNDLCLFAPSWLTDRRLIWHPIDDQKAKVAFETGPYKVTATLYFNSDGELVNFVSEDRGALQGDGSLRILRWSTPMRKYKEFAGRKFATEGEAIWHYPEGDFTYAKITFTNVQSR